MIPATYPSQIDSDNRTQAVIYYLTSITGLERWKDYIPVRESSLASPELNSFNTNGAILTTTLSSISGKQAWVDYIPVYRDDLATDAWSVSATGYLATKDINSLQALAIIASYGADAHLYLPGVGMINGYTAGNYLDSAGTTAATVDNPVGLVLDGAGSVGAEKVNDSSFNTPSDWNPQTSDWVVSGGKATYTKPVSGVQWLEPITAVPLTAGKTYRLSLVISGIGASQHAVFGLFNQASSANLLGAYQIILANGSYEYVFTVESSTPNIKLYGNSAGSTASWYADSISVKEVTGIHALQATTANKPILRRGVVTGGVSSPTGNYWWQFDGSNDSLALGSVPFQMADDHCVIAATSGVSAASYPSIFAIRGATTNPTIAAMSLEANIYRLVYRDDAGTLQLLSCGSVTNGELFVATARKVGNTKQGRKNAGAWSSNATALGATTVTQSWIGRGASASGYWNGAIYPIIIIKGTVSDADLLTLERFVGRLSGVVL